MKRYKIADLNVDMQCNFEIMQRQSIPYEVQNDGSAADITVVVPDEYMKFGKETYPHLTDSDIEYLYAGTLFYLKLIRFGGMLLHSSAVVKDGYAYLFSADPGTGKSTHTARWVKVFGDSAFIINDDKPAIRIVDDEIFVYGTPFSGKTDLNVNTKVKLGGICFLSRSEENWIKPMLPSNAVVSALRQTAYKLSEKDMPIMLDVLDKVLSSVPIWEMGCNISDEAVLMAYNTMKREEKLDA